MRYLVVCKSCGNVEKNNIISCSICSKSLEIKYLGDANKNNKVKYSPYREFLPFDGKVFNKFPNSPTPVIQFNEKNIYAKLEYCGFSSSSKDREAFVEIMVAKELGYKGIAAASTVNMGGALASLCAMLKYPCYIFIPNDTSENKVRQIEQFGAGVKKISGIYDNIVPLVKEFSEKNRFLLASLQPFRFEGYKTIAYEIFEKFGQNLPENIIIPLGDGTTYVGVGKGFDDLKSLGLINKCPSLIGVQAKQCSPIVNTFINKNRIKIIKNPNTIAKAIRIGNPLDGEYAIEVANTTNGSMYCYEENQIKAAYKSLSKEGVNAEYASALIPTIFPLPNQTIRVNEDR